MNEIRKNNENEEVLLKLAFEMPNLWKKIWIICLCVYGIPAVLSLFGIPVLILGIVLFRRAVLMTRKWECEITNKNIKGKTGVFNLKSYSYRLDMIDNIELEDFFGVTNLKLLFTQGKNLSSVVVAGINRMGSTMGKEFVSIKWIINVQEAYEKLTEILGAIKNEVDVKIDMEMKKIEAEEKKADAFYKMAEGIIENNNKQKEEKDYISEMERLYKLKEQGIISEEEFENKKKKLL